MKRTVLNRIVLSLILLLLVHVTSVQAQDSLRMRYGLFGGYSFNMHTADFRALPGVPNCCPLFRNGTGGGLFGGIGYEVPLSSSILFSLRLSYQDQSATLKELEAVRVIANGVGQDGMFEHTVDATVATLGIEPGVRFRLFDNFFLDAGVRGAALSTATYTQKEEIVQPTSTATFLDSLGNDSHSRIRNQSTGDLPDKSSALFHAIGGLSYELSMNARHTMLLVPAVSYTFALNDVVKGLNWKPNSLRAELAVKYSPLKEPPMQVVYDTIYERDTVIKKDRSFTQTNLVLQGRSSQVRSINNGQVVTERTVWKESYVLQVPDPHDITAHLTVAGLDDNNNEESIATLRIEEFLSTNAHPLLGYIFFDKNRSELAARYVSIPPSASASYKLQSLFSLDALGIHHNVLNIIGYRMKQYPNATLTLTGCNSNESEETGNKSLSEARANTIKEYLQSVWQINPSRLKTVIRDLPEKPSNPKSQDGQEENRRVEITSSVPEVLDVFLANDTIRTPNPPQLRFKLATTSSVGVQDWDLQVMQGSQLLKQYQGSGTAPTVIDWDLANNQSAIPHYSEPLQVVLRTHNTKGDLAVDSSTLPTQVLTVEQKKARKAGDVVIDRFNLVLFDFGKADITDAHRRIVNIVNKKIRPESSIDIDGYTDRSGSAAGNARLALSRAQATADALGRKDAKVRGIGEARLLYPNDTPEGRFYCRTVQITVHTPIK